MLEPGKYTAKISDYAIITTSKGDPAIKIEFWVKTELGNDEHVSWQGSFKEGKAREITMKALLTCGLCSPANLADLAKRKEGHALDLGRDISITVKHDQVGDKTYANVEWINPVGGMAFMNTMAQGDFAAHISRMGLEGSFMAIAKEHGISAHVQGHKAQPMATATPKSNPFDDIPF